MSSIHFSVVIQLLLFQLNALSQTIPTTYSTAGSFSWVVPYGVNVLQVTLQGASGGGGASCSFATGGLGGVVSATLNVFPGLTLSINVGGQGTTDTGVGGFNGGGSGGTGSGGCSGSGGGGTDIRTIAADLTTRIVVAGGGGGIYGACPANGGNGGYPAGESGSTGCYVGAGGGSQISGGVGAVNGLSGTLGLGGNGEIPYSGGGGGGYYGGGGGSWSGGGGGSSYCDESICTSAAYSTASAFGDGSVTISNSPTFAPTASTAAPTENPTFTSTIIPTLLPSCLPTTLPTIIPSIIPTMTPSTLPSIKPTILPSLTPTILPTIIPTIIPTNLPTAQPTIILTIIPSIIPTQNPTFSPTVTPTAIPTITPTLVPTPQPTPLPTQKPTQTPTVTPTVLPTSHPSMQPSLQPSQQPFTRPSVQPSEQPFSSPSKQPSTRPSKQPSFVRPSKVPSAQPSTQPLHWPSKQPLSSPSNQPSLQPSQQPKPHPSSMPSVQPSKQPLFKPSQQPSEQPTKQPISNPSMHPSRQPSRQPSKRPSCIPSIKPSAYPSSQPTVQPTSQPFSRPSKQPTAQPLLTPSNQPSYLPSVQPTSQPLSFPSDQPVKQPSKQPIFRPSCQPSTKPSRQPSGQPSVQPRVYPSSGPTTSPSTQPSTQPSWQPSSQPSITPSSQPTRRPTKQPTYRPSQQPVLPPSFQPFTKPSSQPTAQPSWQPSKLPSEQPSTSPTVCPSKQPLLQPTRKPSTQPSREPSSQPLKVPSSQPSRKPSSQPLRKPSSQPSSQPSLQPTTNPSQRPSHQPSKLPSMLPTVQPTFQPSLQPSGQPTTFPSLQPTSQPTMQPSTQPSKQPFCKPSKSPSEQPTIQPSHQPLSNPSIQPIIRPSIIPSTQPTLQPSIQPSYQPSRQPNAIPSRQPSTQPSFQPSSTPSTQPSIIPSLSPSVQPSFDPTLQPSYQPSSRPTKAPSKQPYVQPSKQPTSHPSLQPTCGPTTQPTFRPSFHPSSQPSSIPTHQPIKVPSTQPTVQPSIFPSTQPTVQPSSHPSLQPSLQPSSVPSAQPSSQPLLRPSLQPLTRPSTQPSSQPTTQPTFQPTIQPSRQPWKSPTKQPTSQPTFQPSLQPSSQPIVTPSSNPSNQPTFQPSSNPSSQPTRQPKILPSKQPSAQPTFQPFSKPSNQPIIYPSSQPLIKPSTQPTYQPTLQPSRQPMKFPSIQPTATPSCQPWMQPSFQPVSRPSTQPSIQPSSEPSNQPSQQPSPQPTIIPSEQPTYQPTLQPSRQPMKFPTIQPTTTPSCQPRIQPSSQPTTIPSSQPSIQPSSKPSNQPSQQPSTQPTIMPSEQPTSQPVNRPSSQPSIQPFSQPSVQPSCRPSSMPSAQPSVCPFFQPSVRPSWQPSIQPSSLPTEQPFTLPSQQPSIQPSCKPSSLPSCQPNSQPSIQPSVLPSSQSLGAPSDQPSYQPSFQPLNQPSVDPSSQPSDQPSLQPVIRPTLAPSLCPSNCPSIQPLIQPSKYPSTQPLVSPSTQPRGEPSLQPYTQPSVQPQLHPSIHPIIFPSFQPSSRPSVQPIHAPSHDPSLSPTNIPSTQPRNEPSPKPSTRPIMQPSCSPSFQPMQSPTSKPSTQPYALAPSGQPLRRPSRQPTSQPTRQPRRKPTLQPLRHPSSQPSRRPIRRPSYQPSRSPTCQPFKDPSSQPKLRPTSQPNRQPTSSPTAKSKRPSYAPVSIFKANEPTPGTTVSPTKSVKEELNSQVQSVISDLTEVDGKQSVYHQVDLSSYSQRSNCLRWAAFIQNDLLLMQSTYRPTSLTLVSITQPDYLSNRFIFSKGKYVCEDSAIAKLLVNTIASPAFLPADHGVGRMTTVACSGYNWTVYSCSSDMAMPLSLCVNCSSPCSRAQNTTADISACSGYTATPDTPEMPSSAQILSIGYANLFQPPELAVVNITSSRSTIAISATMSSSGELTCAVYLSTAASPRSYEDILLQNFVSSSDSKNATSILITGLQAITQYKLYCFTSSYGVKTALETVLQKYSLVTTKCCKYVSVYQSTSSLVEGVNAINFLSTKISSYPTGVITVQVLLVKSAKNGTKSNVMGTTLIPSNFLVDSRKSSSSLQLSSSLSNPIVGSYAYTIEIGGSSANEFEVVYLSGQNPVFTVTAANSIQPAPSLTQAVFSDDGSFFTILFDSATNKGATTTLFNCAQLFEFSCAGRSQCQWQDSQHVLAYVHGSSRCALPGDVIRVSHQAAIKAPCRSATGRCSSYSSWPNTTRSGTILQGPVSATAPQVVLTMPAVVGSCDSLSIDIGSSTGSGGRPWTAATIQVRRSDNGDMSSLQAYLNTSFRVFPPTIIPSTLLQRGVSYTFSVMLCNFLRSCNQASKLVAILESVMPTVYLPGQPFRSVTRSSLLSVESAASASVCPGENSKSVSLQYSWSVSQNGIPLLGLSSQSKDPSKLLLPPFSLTASAFYTIQVVVTLQGSLNSAAASCVVFVPVGKIVTVISGSPSRNMKVLSSISLNASRSYDEDQNGMAGIAAGLLFTWSCVQIAPILSSSCAKTLVWSSSLLPVITLSSLAASAGTTSVVTVMVADSRSSRKATSTVTITIVPRNAAIVSTSSGLSAGVVNPDQTLQLLGSVLYPDFSFKAKPVVRWSISDSSVNLTEVALTPVSFTLSSANSNFFLVISPSTLPIGSVLTFSLSCCNGTGLSAYSSSVTVTINSPPQAGGFLVLPNPGIELKDKFLFSAGQWTDSDLPMQYQFGYRSPLGSTITTLSKSLKSSGTSLLPAGADSMDNILETFLVVFDAMSANSSLSYPVVVNHDSEQTNALEMISAVVRNSGNLSTASVDQVKQFNGLVTYLMGKVNCSLSPNCSALHRRACSTTSHTCGGCIPLYVGESGDSNSICILKSALFDLSSASNAKVNCNSDFQCSGFRRCINASCAAPQKSCVSDCFGNGVCRFVNSNTGSIVSDCRIDDSNCNAECDCNQAYAESLHCNWNTSEMQDRRNLKSQVFSNIEHLASLEYPDADAVSGWIASMDSASKKVDELTDGSVNVILGVSSLILQSSHSIGVGSNSLLGLASSLNSGVLFMQKSINQKRFTRYLTSGTISSSASTDGIEQILNHLRQYGLAISGTMLPGQAAVETAQTAFLLCAAVVPSYQGGSDSGSSNSAVSMPQSDLELATGLVPAAVAVPFDRSTIAGEDYLFMTSISMPSSVSRDALQANPLIVYLSRLPCVSPSGCEIEFTVPQTKPSSQLLQNSTALNETATVLCKTGVLSETNYTCSNGYVLNLTCDGTFTGKFRRRCPSLRYYSSCNLLDNQLNAQGVGQCRDVSRSNSLTVCKCPLLTNSTPVYSDLANRRLQTGSNSSIQGVHSIAVSTLLVAVASGMESTILSATELSAEVIAKEVTVLATLAVLVIVFIAFIGTSTYLDYKYELLEKVENGKESSVAYASANLAKAMPSSSGSLRSKRKRLSIASKSSESQEMSMLEESLPSIFSSEAFATRLSTEVKRNHKWFGVIFHHSKVFPRVLRAMSLCSNIILMLFVQSMTYNLTNPDDGSCEMLDSLQACEQPKTSFGTGGKKCMWSEGSCRFIQPSADLTVILFVACFSALVTTPISLTLNWLIFRVLAAPTLKPTDQVLPDPTLDTTRANLNQVETVAGNDFKLFAVRNAATEELKQLSKGLLSYRILLNTQQREEFDKLWGLGNDGSFLSVDRTGLLKTQKSKKDVAEVLVSELEMVATTVEKERKRIDGITLQKEKQKRLLYLFQRDLLPGVSGKILHAKVQREDVKVHGVVSITYKAIVYLTILSSNAAMLFYVFLFALGQTKYRQDAWFRSFVIWISMEIFVVGTVIVLLTHVVLPSLIMPDIAKIKEKLVDSIRDYQKDLKNKTEEEKADAGEKLFNSAEFFFASSKLAKFYMDLPVARIISKFSTPWPRQSYQHVVDVSRRYDRRFSGLSSSVGIILFFFIGSFLNTPLGVQDGLLHSLFTVAVGYLVLLHIQLYNVQPALAFIPLFTICTVAHFIILSYKYRFNRAAVVTPIVEDRNDKNVHAKVKVLVSRRDSILAGVNIAVTAQNCMAHSDEDRSLCIIDSESSLSLGSISLDTDEIEILSDNNSTLYQEKESHDSRSIDSVVIKSMVYGSEMSEQSEI